MHRKCMKEGKVVECVGVWGCGGVFWWVGGGEVLARLHQRLSHDA